MGDRVNEVKGNVKKGVGKLTGNERMEGEGKAEATTARGARKVKGVADEAKGHVKEGLGSALGNERMRAEGTADRAKGSAKRAG